jgi:hypothetical protein
LDNERVLATLTSVGINGTVATIGAQLAGINLWSQFQLSQPDLRYALTLGLGTLLYEYALLGARWTPALRPAYQRSPPPAAGSQSPLSDLDDAIDEAVLQTTGAASRERSIQSDEDAASIRAAVATPSSEPPQTTAPPSQNKHRKSGTGAAAPPPPFNMQLSAALVAPDGDQRMSAELLKATLALQQACVVASATMMRADVPPLADAGLVLLRNTAKVCVCVCVVVRQCVFV